MREGNRLGFVFADIGAGKRLPGGFLNGLLELVDAFRRGLLGGIGGFQRLFGGIGGLLRGGCRLLCGFRSFLRGLTQRGCVLRACRKGE